MGKVFWLVNVAILVVALGLWGVGTLGVRGEARELKAKVDLEVAKIERLHTDRDNLPNNDFIEAARKRKSLVKDEKEKIKKVMRLHDLNVRDWDWGRSAPPKGDDLALFHDWLEEQYKEKNEALSKAGIVFPEAPEQADARGEVKDWEEVTTHEIPRLLRELVVMREICSAIADAGARVTYMVKKEGGKIVPATNTRKVDQLKLLEFGVRRRSGLRRAEAEPEEDKPHREHVVTVTFVSHANVVSEVMRRVERSKKVLFVVRSATLRRSGEKSGFGTRGLPTAPTEEKFLRNAEDHEAPVEAQIRFGFFEFPVARETAAREQQR